MIRYFWDELERVVAAYRASYYRRVEKCGCVRLGCHEHKLEVLKEHKAHEHVRA